MYNKDEIEMINFNNASFLKSIGNLKQLENDNVSEVVFSGKSNVGKSSLINKLLNRKSLARTSTKPGKTINLNLYSVDKIRFVDLPGYGYAKVSFAEKKRWSKLVEGYFSESKNISLVVQVIDMRHSPSSLDFQMMDYLYENKFTFVIVSSKSDKLRKIARIERERLMNEELRKYKNIEKIIFSALSGEGTDELKSIVCKYCNA